MTNTGLTVVIVPLADWRAKSICGATCQELSERLPFFDSYLPEEIDDAAAHANDRDNVATTVLDGYRAALDTKGVRCRRRVRRQLEAAEHAIAVGGPLRPAQVERLGRLVQSAIADRDEALRTLDERLRLARRILAEAR